MRSFKASKTKPIPIDPEVRALMSDGINRDVSAYLDLLDREVSEQEVHAFLAAHTYFFNNIVRLFGVSPVYSKLRLGSQYEVDFACFDSGSYGPEWRLIEIEAPSRRMFNERGDPTAALTHAIQQVRDWHAWIHENLDYARKLMPHIEYPLGYVFLGRRRYLTDITARKLRRLVHDHRSILRIHTLDWFASAGASVENLVRDGRGGSWPLPMHAFSHSDLVNGRPEWAREFLQDPRVIESLEFYREERLSQRESVRHLDAEYESGKDESE